MIPARVAMTLRRRVPGAGSDRSRLPRSLPRRRESWMRGRLGLIESRFSARRTALIAKHHAPQ